MNGSRRYGIAFFVVAFVFVAANIRSFLRPVTCFDCFFPYGVPFTLYQEGGYAGGAGIVWRGLAADITIVIVTSALAGRIWQMFAGKNAN
jgi:hypothetical protein